MTRISVGLLLAAALIVSVLGCADTSTKSVASAPTVAPSIVWKFQSLMAASDRTVVYWQQPFAKEVERLSNGRLKIEMYYSSGLGIKPAELAGGLKENMLAAAHVALGTWSGTVPETEVPELPGLVAGDTSLRKEIVRTVYAPYIEKALMDKLGVLALSIIYAEPRDILSTKTIKSLSDIKGKSIRVMNALEGELTTALGAKPVSLSVSEMQGALQQGVIEGVWSPYAGTRPGVAETAKYVYQIGSGGAMIAIGISPAAFNALPSDLRDVVRQAAQSAADQWWTAMPANSVREREQMIAAGNEFATPAEQDVAAFRKIGDDIAAARSKQYGAGYQKLLDDIRQSVAKYGKK